MIDRRAVFLALVLLFAGLAATGYWLLFANLPSYDDEGYILMSAREYWAKGALYDSVYSQYGPAFYVLTDALQRVLGRPLDHTTARLMTLVFWLCTSGACATLVHRHTRSMWLTAFAAASTFLYLYFIPDEPFHPGIIIIALLALSLLASDMLLSCGHSTRAAATLGATTAVLLLLKINVGVFYAAAAGAWFALHHASPALQRAARWLLPVALGLFAAALMRTLWAQTWVHTYLAVFACAATALVVSTRATPLTTIRNAISFGAAGGLVAFAMIGAVLARGTSIAGLLDGMLWEPLRHAGNYSYAVDWRPGTLGVAFASVFLAGMDRWLRGHQKNAAADAIIVALRLVVAAAALVAFVLLMHARVIGAVFSYVAPLIWIWIVPLATSAEKPATRAIRHLVACVLLLQFLHAYPIGGIQESWGTFLFFPLLAIGLSEAGEWLCVAPAAPRLGRRAWRIFATVTICAVIAKVGWVSIKTQRTFESRLALNLPGAENLRLPEAQRTAYRILCLNATVHADVLFSLPGMFSFNVWTGLPSPTAKNTTLWFTLLSDADQRAIIVSLDRTPRACLIVEETLLQLMREGNIPVGGILHDYLLQNFTRAFKLSGFAFLTRTGCALAPLHVAALVSARAEPDVRRKLVFHFVADGTPIAAIEAAAMEGDAPARITLDASNSQVTIAPIDRAGNARAALSETAWPIRTTGLVMIAVEFDSRATLLPPTTQIFYLRRADGSILGEVRLPD